jgi:hypothetical protein
MKMLLKEAALQGARDIVAEWINENIYENNYRLYERKAAITTKVVKTKKTKRPKSSTNILIGQSPYQCTFAPFNGYVTCARMKVLLNSK